MYVLNGVCYDEINIWLKKYRGGLCFLLYVRYIIYILFIVKKKCSSLKFVKGFVFYILKSI